MASSSSNNRFATLSCLNTPSGKFVLESIASGDKQTPAATGSNAIPIAPGNKKTLGSKVGTGLTSKKKPVLNTGSKKLLPNVWATLASQPGLSTPRSTSKLLPQAKSYISPSKRAMSMPLPKVAESCLVPTRDQFPTLVPCQFLRSPKDQQMNSSSSKSYSHVATKGIQTGSKQTFRSEEASLPSWNETWMMPEDWLPVLMNEKNISPTQNLSAFRATFPVNMPWSVVNEDDDVEMGQGR